MTNIDKRAETQRIRVLMLRAQQKEADKRFLQEADVGLKELYSWVLSKMENPTAANASDHIILESMRDHTVRIGKKIRTDMEMKPDDLQELARMFNGTEGFWSKYTPGNYKKANSVTYSCLEVGIE